MTAATVLRVDESSHVSYRCEPPREVHTTWPTTSNSVATALGLFWTMLRIHSTCHCHQAAENDTTYCHQPQYRPSPTCAATSARHCRRYVAHHWRSPWRSVASNGLKGLGHDASEVSTPLAPKINVQREGQQDDSFCDSSSSSRRTRTCKDGRCGLRERYIYILDRSRLPHRQYFVMQSSASEPISQRPSVDRTPYCWPRQMRGGSSE